MRPAGGARLAETAEPDQHQSAAGEEQWNSSRLRHIFQRDPRGSHLPANRVERNRFAGSHIRDAGIVESILDLSRIVPLLVRRREAVSPIAKITVRTLIEMHQGRAAAIDGKVK